MRRYGRAVSSAARALPRKSSSTPITITSPSTSVRDRPERVADEVGAVIERDDLHAGGQAAVIQLVQAALTFSTSLGFSQRRISTTPSTPS